MEKNELVMIYLNKIVNSSYFEKTTKLTKLLTYIVNKTLNGEASEIKEYTLAIDVFEEKNDFDPALNSKIRVIVFNLRKRLKEYYAFDGKDDLVKIIIPIGKYIAIFDFRDQTKNNLIDDIEDHSHIVDSNYILREPLTLIIEQNQFDDSMVSERVFAFQNSMIYYLKQHPFINVKIEYNHENITNLDSNTINNNNFNISFYKLHLFLVQDTDEIIFYLNMENIFSNIVIWSERLIYNTHSGSYISWVDLNTQKIASIIGRNNF